MFVNLFARMRDVVRTGGGGIKLKRDVAKSDKDVAGSEKAAIRGSSAGRSLFGPVCRVTALLLAFTLCVCACGKKKDTAEDGKSKGTSSSSASKKPGSGSAGSDTDGQEATSPVITYSTEEEAVTQKITDPNFNLASALRTARYFKGDVEKIAEVPYPSKYPGLGIRTPQGGCFDGRYWYQAFINAINYGQELENPDVVVKYDTVTGQVVAESEVIKMNHANDIAYNPRTNELVVAHCMGPGNLISVLDADTLKLKRGPIDIKFNINAIDYNAKRNQYVALLAATNNFGFLDANFQWVGEICDGWTTALNYTTQGICCDDNYIYHGMYNPNCIVVYDWNGNFVTCITLDKVNGETENMTVIGNDVYLGITDSFLTIYKLKSITVDTDR